MPRRRIAPAEEPEVHARLHQEAQVEEGQVSKAAMEAPTIAAAAVLGGVSEPGQTGRGDVEEHLPYAFAILRPGQFLDLVEEVGALDQGLAYVLPDSRVSPVSKKCGQ